MKTVDTRSLEAQLRVLRQRKANLLPSTRAAVQLSLEIKVYETTIATLSENRAQQLPAAE